MIVLPKHHYATLKANGDRYAESACDLVPVVKFHDPSGTAKWLITRLSPREPDILYGLCDLGIGLPLLGPVLFSELAMTRGRLGTGIERDILFQAVHPLSVYAHAAQRLTHITDDATELARSAIALGFDAAPHLPIPGKTPRQ